MLAMQESKHTEDPMEQTTSEAAKRGGIARAQRLSKEDRKAIARNAARARWGGERSLTPVEDEPAETGPEMVSAEEGPGPDVALPVAVHRGVLVLLGMEIPCYVLDDGQRVIGRTSATEMLTGIKGGGAFEKYISVTPLRPFINTEEVLEQMVSFRLPEVQGLEKSVKGLPADLLIEVCQGFVKALEMSTRPDATYKLTSRQLDMAMQASMFLSAIAKTGLVALIDEATGYQYERAEDALQVKLRAYLSEEMRPWEKTFPDELWKEFGRLTGWQGAITKRPKYWGKLVNELIYDYLDPDVYKWLRENAPAPRHGRNYHSWLSDQFGLKKLIEHIWMVIGLGSACADMSELKARMAAKYGRIPFQFKLYIPAHSEESEGS